MILLLFHLPGMGQQQGAGNPQDPQQGDKPPAKKLKTEKQQDVYLRPVGETVDGEDMEIQWLDDFHASLSSQFESTAQQIDDFFGDEEDYDTKDAKIEARIKLGWEPRSRDWGEYDLRFRAKVRLPKLKNRVDLMLSDVDDDELESTVAAAREDAFSQDDSYNLSLRYRVSPNAKVSTKLGIGRTDQIYIRTRYRDFGNFTENTSYRYSSSINYYSDDEFGADAGFTIDHDLTDTTVLRFDTRFYYSRDKSNDWTWRHRLEHLSLLDDKSALIYGVYVDGSDDPNYQLDKGLIYARWRKNALRKWLFFEVEPFVIWYRDESFSASYGLAMRVEGYYGKI